MILRWNNRGLNKSLRQIEANKVLKNNKVVLAGLLETRVKQQKADRVRSSFGSNMEFVDNYGMAVNGRMWVMWDKTQVHSW